MNVSSALVQNNIIIGNTGAHGAGAGVWKVGNAELAKLMYDERSDDPFRHADAFRKATSESVPDLGCVVFMNNTIYDNVSQQRGGGVHVREWETYVVNTIVWGNQAGSHDQIWDESGHLTVHNSDIQGGWNGAGENNIQVDPLFKDDSLKLGENSPCIDKGIATIDINGTSLPCPATCYYKNPRPWSLHGEQLPDIGAAEFYVTRVVDKPIAPKEFVLLQNYPNPFNPTTTISYESPKETDVTLIIHDLLGRHICSLVNESQPAGQHRCIWNSTNDFGEPAPAGLYFCRLTARNYQKTIKLLLVK